MKLDIELSPAQADRLRQEAERLKITPEELARAAVSDLLSERDQDFKIAAAARAPKIQRALPTPSLMRYLTLAEIVDLHRMITETTGGAAAFETSAHWNLPSPNQKRRSI